MKLATYPSDIEIDILINLCENIEVLKEKN